MSTLLAVMTYPAGSDAFVRHAPYFARQEADYNFAITTETGDCNVPKEFQILPVGRDSYIDGAHLPNRMLDTIERLLSLPWSVLILAEYDTLFIHRIRVEAMEHAVAAHLAGGQTWGSKATKFYHNPHVLIREAAINFLKYGREAVAEGVCGERSGSAYTAPEGSPDVFFGFVTEKHNMAVQENLWTEYSRNSFDQPGHLEEARQAYRNVIDIIHGIKTKEQLEYVTL